MRMSDLRDSKVGEGALMNYQKYYKDSSRLVEKHQMQGKQVENPLLAYLTTVSNAKKAPKGFGMVKRKKKDEINLKSFYLRESYIDAFSDGLQL